MDNYPEKFEEFTKARKNGFVKVKNLKEEGSNIVGIFCTYTPVEIIMAASAIPVSLCGISEEPIPDAEKTLPRNLCPLIKSSYGHAVTDTCPYFYFSDFLVGETTCDGKKKMYEQLGKLKDMHIMNLPNACEDDKAYELWKHEVIKLKEVIQKKFEVKITDEKLKDAIKIKNKERIALKEFYELAKLMPPPISGFEMQEVLSSSQFIMNSTELIENLTKMKENALLNYKQYEDKRPRILITGCPISGVSEKIIKTIEDMGAVVVAFENCGGIKANDELVDENIDPIDAIAKKYINIACSCMSPNESRLTLLSKIIDEYRIDGVVDVILMACHTYNIETYKVKEFVTKEKQIPYINVETDYSKSDLGQLKTRLGAFVEMI